MIRSKRLWGHLEWDLFLPPLLLELHVPATPGLRLPEVKGERLQPRAPGRPSYPGFATCLPLGKSLSVSQPPCVKQGWPLRLSQVDAVGFK